MGSGDGCGVGARVGNSVGRMLGTGDGFGMGKCVGASVGRMLGTGVGSGVGTWVGADVGRGVGFGELGWGVGMRLGWGVGVNHFPIGTPSPAATASALSVKLLAPARVRLAKFQYAGT